MAEYPAMRLLLDDYLNRGWFDRYSSVQHAFSAFLYREPLAGHLKGEVGSLLAEYPSEDALETHFVRDLDPCFHPYEEGSTVRDWLTVVAQRSPRPVGFAPTGPCG